LKCPSVDSGFKKLSHTIHAISTHSIQIDIFLCSFIQFLAKNATTTAVHTIADLDNVKTIAASHNIVSKKFKFLPGFLIKFFNSCHVHPHKSNINGKNATKKYP
jgi:hypothetical protein